MTFIEFLVLVVVSALITYFGLAFTLLELDVFMWPEHARAMLPVLTILLAMLLMSV